ncbi:MAG: glycosyltransferase [Chthoniobacterales bacterium]
MKRVLHIIDHLGLGGAQAVLFDLVTLADRSQWKIEVAAMHGRGLFAEELEKHGITVHSLAASSRSLRYLPAFAKLQRNFDLLHFHLSGANWIAKPLAAFASEQPRIVHDHASADLRFRGIGSMMIDAMMHRFSSHTVAVSPEVKTFLQHYEALSSDEVTVIPNGINTEIFRPCTTLEKKEARLRFDLKENEIVIGTVGRLASEKNQKLFLQGAKQSIDRGLYATFLLAGTGPEEVALRLYADELKISEHVKFLGQVNDRISLYRALDLFALTSLYEGLPMVLLEAMASGIPVLSTDLEGIRHALENGYYGTLIPSGDAEALADGFLNHANERGKELAASARQHVEKNFSARKSVKQISELYYKLL